MGIIVTPIRAVFDWVYGFLGNYALTIIAVTLLIKLILLPLDYKSRKSMHRMQKLTPQLADINKKYANDPDKRNQKTMELYKKSGVSMFSGCLPLLIQMPVLIAMFTVFRYIADEQIVKMYQTVAAGQTFVPEGFLWVHNIWRPDNIIASVLPDISSISAIKAISSSNIVTAEAVEAMKANYETVMAPLVESWAGTANGYALLPIISGGTQFLMTKLTPSAPSANDAQGGGSMKIMNMIFPLISVFFCWQYNAAFALYWVTSNVYSLLQIVLINKYLEHKDKKDAEKEALQN